MSKRSLYRYKNPKSRELSREDARRNNAKRTKHGECEKCHEPIKNHARCLECRILLHSYTLTCRCGYKHGQSSDGIYCDDCIGTLSQEILSPYEEYKTYYGEIDH